MSQTPRVTIKYAGRDYVIVFDLLTIENIENATGLGIEALATQFADDTKRKMSTFGRLVYGCLLREIPDMTFEVFATNYAPSDFAKTIQFIAEALIASTNSYMGGLAEVEEKKGSTENQEMTPGSGIVSAAVSEAKTPG